MARQSIIKTKKIEKDPDGTVYIKETIITNTVVTLDAVQAELTKVEAEKTTVTAKLDSNINRLQTVIDNWPA